MRNYITRSIANVICRYRAAAVDMLRSVKSPASQWHVQLCNLVSKPTGDALQRRHSRPLTSAALSSDAGNGCSIVNFLSAPLSELLKPANQWLLVETTGSLCQTGPGRPGQFR